MSVYILPSSQGDYRDSRTQSCQPEQCKSSECVFLERMLRNISEFVFQAFNTLYRLSVVYTFFPANNSLLANRETSFTKTVFVGILSF